MAFRSSLFAFIGLLVITLIPARGMAQTLSIGDQHGAPGERVTLPIWVSSTSELAALNLRLSFDPEVLQSPSPSPGSLLTSQHGLYWSTPDLGVFNIVVYATDGAIPFANTEGAVLELAFQISAGAVPGTTTEIGFVSTGSASLPSSDLSGLGGESLPHTPIAGTVSFVVPSTPTQTPTVTSTPSPTPMPVPGDTNGDGIVDQMDILYFSLWWQTEENETNYRANPIKGDNINEKDLLDLMNHW